MAADYLTTVAKRLRRTIPAPREEPAKPQDSWHLLKAGQRLRSKVPITSLTGAKIGDGVLFEVMSCSNKGALMKPLGEDTEALGLVLWSDPEWRTSFERTRRPKG